MFDKPPRWFLPDKFDVSPHGCWLWRGSLNDGYGQMWVRDNRANDRPSRRRLAAVHRHVYERLVGPIPDGLVLDHLCGVRRCANPDHLRPVKRAPKSCKTTDSGGI